MLIKSKKIGLAVSLLASPMIGNTTSNTELDLEAVTSASNAIVAGQVLSTKTMTDGNAARTVVSVQVNDEIKGDTAETIEIVIPGGSYKVGRFRVGETHAGTPRMFENQQNIYFLNSADTDGRYQIVGFNQGMVAIESLDGKAVVRGTLTQGQAIPMAEMKAKIASAEGQ